MDGITNASGAMPSDNKDGSYGEDVGAAITEDLKTMALMDGTALSIGPDTTLNMAGREEKLRIEYARLGQQGWTNVIPTHPILHYYLMEHSLDYRYVTLWRHKCEASEEGDKHFMMLQEKADNPDPHTQKVFYNQMCQIGEDMDETFNLSNDLELSGNLKVLDLCMAPGGFAGTMLNRAQGSQVCGVSLPVDIGGHPLCIDNWENRDVQVHWLDITMLSTEMGLDNIPPDHPEASKFMTLRPYLGQSFALVFCDGNALRIHDRLAYRERKERHRLLTSQLVLAFQRIQDGGTLVCRFHRIEGIDTAGILELFGAFSSVQVFKPRRIHGARSSFYMIAKDMQPQHLRAVDAVKKWKQEWAEATLDTEEREARPAINNTDPARIEKAKAIVEGFGTALIKLAEPIWRIQSISLRNKPFFTGRKTTFSSDRGIRPDMRSNHTHTPRTPSLKDSMSKGNWRSSMIPNDDKLRSPPHISSAKAGRYLAPQQRSSPFMGRQFQHMENIRPKTLYEARVPVSSGFWKGDPRTSTNQELKDSSDSIPLQEDFKSVARDEESIHGQRTSIISNDQLDTAALARHVLKKNKTSATETGTPGGALLNATNLSTSPTRQRGLSNNHVGGDELISVGPAGVTAPNITVNLKGDSRGLEQIWSTERVTSLPFH